MLCLRFNSGVRGSECALKFLASWIPVRGKITHFRELLVLLDTDNAEDFPYKTRFHIEPSLSNNGSKNGRLV